MNLYIKYAPLLYTFHTRRKTLKSVFRCSLLDIWFWFVSIFYLYLNNSISLSKFVFSGALFIGLFYLFNIFYEIGYIQNDLIVSKKEKKPTLRVKEPLSNKFILYQIIIRIILWSCIIWLIWYLDYKIAIIYSIIIIITVITFYLHNIIRNYFWNFITFFLLRFMKFSIIIPIIYFCIHTLDSSLYLYIIFLFILMQFWININIYNKYYWWDNKYPQTLMLFYLFVGCLIFYIFSKESLFILYSAMYIILFIIETPKKYFSFKNNR